MVRMEISSKRLDPLGVPKIIEKHHAFLCPFLSLHPPPPAFLIPFFSLLVTQRASFPIWAGWNVGLQYSWSPKICPATGSAYHLYGKPGEFRWNGSSRWKFSGKKSNTFRGITVFLFLQTTEIFCTICLDYLVPGSMSRESEYILQMVQLNHVPVFDAKKISEPFDGNFSPKFPY